VGALALLTCVEGAWLNVKINATELKEHKVVRKLLEEGRGILDLSRKRKEEILELVNKQIGL
jgi:glutamate formiminotransferase/formiminotetrahydrofolate cyclodeaminase